MPFFICLSTDRCCLSSVSPILERGIDIWAAEIVLELKQEGYPVPSIIRMCSETSAVNPMSAL